MEKFQNYLDKALENLDVHETQSENEEIEKNVYDISSEVSELIQSTRKEIGLSQRELSEKTQISQANISKIENGHITPSIEMLKKIADALGKRLVIDFINVESKMED